MMITFQRQIESVGSHQALISRPADRVQRRCSCIRFHRRRRLRVEADRGQVTNRQTLRAEATLSALCIQKQWDPRRLRGTRQTSWNYSFPPTGSDCTAHTAGLRLLTAQTVCLSRLHILITCEQRAERKSRGGSRQGAAGVSRVWRWKLAAERSRQPPKKHPHRICMLLYRLTNSWGVISFEIEWGVLKHGASECTEWKNGNIYVSTVGRHNNTQVTRLQRFVFWV